MSLEEEISRSPVLTSSELEITLLPFEGCRAVRGGHQVCRGGDETPPEGEQGEDTGADSGQQDQLQVPRSPHGQRDGDIQEQTEPQERQTLHDRLGGQRESLQHQGAGTEQGRETSEIVFPSECGAETEGGGSHQQVTAGPRQLHQRPGGEED